MSKVITSGRMQWPWSIRLKCPKCGCVADYVKADVIVPDPTVDTHRVRCPECCDSIRAPWQCWICKGKGEYTQGVEGYGGDMIDATYLCPCSNMKDRP